MKTVVRFNRAWWCDSHWDCLTRNYIVNGVGCSIVDICNSINADPTAPFKVDFDGCGDVRSGVVYRSPVSIRTELWRMELAAAGKIPAGDIRNGKLDNAALKYNNRRKALDRAGLGMKHSMLVDMRTSDYDVVVGHAKADNSYAADIPKLVDYIGGAVKLVVLPATQSMAKKLLKDPDATWALLSRHKIENTDRLNLMWQEFNQFKSGGDVTLGTFIRYFGYKPDQQRTHGTKPSADLVHFLLLRDRQVIRKG